MNHDALTMLVAQGLAAMKAGAKVAEAATAEIQNDARSADLKEALRQGNDVSQQWAKRIDEALERSGTSGEQQNPILDAHYEVSRRIRQQATDDVSRDLGIIASGQLALHYWIAAFGTIRTYAGAVGLDGVEEAMRASLDEARKADDQHTKLAKAILAG